ncbi:MAG: hypothetical protein HKN91_11155, partial [Acidimicrobiia bacterium]|nr:hypothetical protein [Acidimicrobiia bacterium]
MFRRFSALFLVVSACAGSSGQELPATSAIPSLAPVTTTHAPPASSITPSSTTTPSTTQAPTFVTAAPRSVEEDARVVVMAGFVGNSLDSATADFLTEGGR